jgi:hypothetical protein
MGNKQSIPKEMLDRIEDLEQRIQKGKFSNNDKGIKDIENLLGYWDEKYGIAGQKVEDGKVLLKNHFNCETIVERNFCNKRGDSKCRWDPIDSYGLDYKGDESEEKKNFDSYGGICKYADGVTEHDHQTQRNKYNAAKKKGGIFVKIDDWKNNSVLFKNVDTGETVSEIPEGSRLATNADKKKLDRKTRGMVDEAKNNTKDQNQFLKGSVVSRPLMLTTGRSTTKTKKDGGSKRLRKRRKSRKSRKRRKRRKRRKSRKKKGRKKTINKK